MKQCSIQGCMSPVLARYSPYCATHRRRLARHGGPMQSAIKRRELSPYLDYVAKRQASHVDNAAWTILRSRLQGLYDQALTDQKQARGGYAYLVAKAHAANLLLDLSAQADPDRVIREAVAVVMHCQHCPQRYTTDLAPVYAAARAALALSPSSLRRTWNRAGRVVRTARPEVSPRVLVDIGTRLLEAFGGAGIQLTLCRGAGQRPRSSGSSSRTPSQR